MLPKVSTFEVYGIRNNDALESWPTGKLSWDRAPGSKGMSQDIDESEVQLLGSFDIPRGMLSGTILFESPELLRFIHEDTTGEVGFLLVRATPPMDSWSLVHAFAASTHPAASGPSLELEVQP